jgi:hypothetical protein
MRKLLILLLLAAAAAPVSASTTAFSATLKRSDGTVPKVFLRVSIVNCSTYNPFVSGDHIIANPDGSFDLFPNVSTGVISVNIDDEATITCGITVGGAYYHIATYQGDQTTSTARRKITECDYDITGGTFNMNSATCKAAGTITSPSLAVQKVDNSGALVTPPRDTLNFMNGLQAVDNSGSKRDDISPVYGTTANTVAQGNDSRIVNALQIAGAKVVDGVTYANIAAAITAAGSTGIVIIPPGYAGTDVYTNTNSIQIIDLRGKPDRYRGFINVLTDCGLKGDGVTDDSTAAQACFTAFPGRWFVFPQTQANGSCSYWFASTVFPKGEGARVSGSGGGGFRNSNTGQGGTEICGAAGVTPLWLDMTPNSSSGITIENLSLKGSEGTDHLVTPTKLNIPANLPQYKRNIATIQRTSNVLTVTTTIIGTEGLTQSVGSTVLISGVVGDATMNGRCIIATLTGLNTFSENATGFTCAQNGSDAGPFGAVGTVNIPTTGASTADGIRVCSNFNTIRNVSIDGFGRHGINADMQSGHGCTTNFADDLLLENVVMMGNQGDGFYCQGIDCNAGTMFSNPIYYNLLWGVEDQSAFGNNWFGNQISNNGSQWAVTTTPATKAISTISRTLTSGVSQVSAVLSVADTNLKLGSCVVIAGVTDASFNNTAGQCFFVNSYTDSTHFGYEQPGAPANASSSGGTSRMAKFSEAYLSAGIDSGGVKVATQTQTYSQPWFGNYVEGGQICKFGGMISIGGANMPDCATLNTFRNAVTIRSATPGIVSSSTNIRGLANEVDQNNSINFKAGMSGGTVRDTVFNWVNNNDSSTAWILDVNPTGNLGVSGLWTLKSPFGVTRFSAQGTSLGAGLSRVNSESTGAVEINNCNNCGSGGMKVGSGGATNSTILTVSNTGAVVASSTVTTPAAVSITTNPASAGAVRLAKTDIINARNNANSGDIPLLQLNASDQAVCGNANGCTDINGNKFGTIIASGTSSLGTGSISATTCATVVTTAATNTATTDSIEWAFNAAPGTGYTSGVHVLAYPTSGNVNFLVCNPTAGSLTPAAATLNWRVIR